MSVEADFSNPNLTRFCGGKDFPSCTGLLLTSEDFSSNPLHLFTNNVDFFNTVEGVLVLRFLEIQRIGRENTSRNG